MQLKAAGAARIAFPVFWFSQNLVRVSDSLDDLTHCTKLAYKKGFYKGLILVDTNGYKFEIQNARKLRSLPPKLGVGAILDYVSGNPSLRVELIFAPGEPSLISVEQVKELIFDSFKKEKHLWEEMVDFEEFRDKIAGASSIAQIFSAFREFHT